MPPSESQSAPPRRRFDWPIWLALAWACVFGALYTAMIVESRGASLLAAFGRLLGVVSS